MTTIVDCGAEYGSNECACECHSRDPDPPKPTPERECVCEGEFIWACGPECDCWHHENDPW